MIRRLALAALLTSLAACKAVGPDYRSPEPNAPAQRPFVTRSPAFTGDEPPGQWWRLFNDATLDSLVQQALAANTDLRVAAANLARARAVLQETRGARLPTTNVQAGVTYGQTAGSTIPVPGVSNEPGFIYDAGLDVSYQVDLVGGIRRAIEAARADYGAVQASFDVTRITVVAETTRAYADACSAGGQIRVAQESIRVQERTFDLTRRQFQAGRGTLLEVGQAGSQVDQIRATLPTLEAQRQSALFRLAVLTGRPPGEVPAAATPCETPLRLDKPIPIGDGAGLLARRPDIRRAERELAAATARVGVATADLYPRISLGASVGSTATTPGGLVSSQGFRFSLGPLISWSFPNLTIARARVRQAEATAAAELADFDGTWLRALQETETNLTTYARELDRRALLRRARDQSAEAARVARLRYTAGRENFLIVLDAERELAQTNLLLAQSEATLSTDLVSVFLSLGGGWQD